MALDITFPDGNVKQFPDGTTVKAITEGISNSLAKKAVAGKLDGDLIAYDEPIAHSGKLQIMTKDDAEGLTVLRQTAAFVLAAALKDLYPDIHFGQGQATEDGFYYDTDRADGQVSVDDLPTVQKKMEAIIKENAALEPVVLSRAEAFQAFKNDPFKKQLVEAAGDPIKGYKLGDFVDFEEKVLLPSLKDLKHLKLLSVAGAYWQGKSSNPMLQRIYGTAYWSEKGLEDDAKRRQEAAEHDHRVIGRDLDLFFVDPKVGAGLPYWMPNGATIRRVIERYIIDKEIADGYEHVYTPVLANLDLYKTSGHWDHYREDMFPPMDMGDGEMLELRPMNCPSHIQIYNHHIRDRKSVV